MPKPDRDTGHRLAEGFHPDTRQELFDAWGYDANQRKPRRASISGPRRARSTWRSCCGSIPSWTS